MDWSNIWYDQLAALGESHLLILPNSDHVLATNIAGVLSTVTAFFKSIMSGHTQRPHFTYSHNNETGELTVTIPPGYKPTEVVLRSAQTLSKERRDFRWLRVDNNRTEPCT